MPDALDTLRRHPDLTEAERAALDCHPIPGRTTRAAVASLLTAILCERVEGFRGEPGDWHEAGQRLLKTELDTSLLTYEQVQRGQRAARSLYCPAKLLLLWGDTRQGVERIRTRRAAQRADHQQAA